MLCRHLSILFTPTPSARACARRGNWWRYYRRDDALFLAEKGISVALCEKAALAVNNPAALGLVPHDGSGLWRNPLAMESLRLWRGMNERTGRETGYRQPGIMYLCENERKSRCRKPGSISEAVSGEARLLRGQELDSVMPGASARFVAVCTRQPMAARSPRRPRRRSPKPRATTVRRYSPIARYAASTCTTDDLWRDNGARQDTMRRRRAGRWRLSRLFAETRAGFTTVEGTGSVFDPNHWRRPDISAAAQSSRYARDSTAVIRSPP